MSTDTRLMLRSGPMRASIRPPGSKSITNRALVIAALADGVSTISAALESDDTEVMRSALTQLGVIIHVEDDIWTVHGGKLGHADNVLDVGASGTTARFLTAALTLAEGAHRVDGVQRMRERPIAAEVDALVVLGASVEAVGENGCPPVDVVGPALRGGSVVMDARESSQFVSAVMLVAPRAQRPVEISFLDGLVVSRPYLLTTQEVMEAFGATVAIKNDVVSVAATPYRPTDYVVEADASAAVYPWVAAAITRGRVTVHGLAGNSSQADMGVLDVLAAMGCEIDRGESSVAVEGSAQLRGVDVDMNTCPDGVLGVAVAAMFATSPTTIRNIASLRIKETDRLLALQTEIRRLGGQAETGSDWIRITPAPLRSATIETYDDHRMAMAFALAGLAVPGVVISDPACVSKTWPTFFEDLASIIRPAVVAIDGPGGSGKTSVSRAVSQSLRLPHLDTGAYYRAATIATLEAGAQKTDKDAVIAAVAEATFDYEDGVMLLNGRDVSEKIRSTDVTDAVSAVSAFPEVRTQMVAAQRDWVRQRGGAAVVEGRDIGTVVFPDAPLKFYLTARPEIRAARRAVEVDATPEDIQQGLERRDKADSQRAASPLSKAPDAVVVDTSDLRIDEVIGQLVDRAHEVFGSR